MDASQSEGVSKFFQGYRKLWLALAVITFLTLPFYTLAFFGQLSWLSPAAGLMGYLGTFVLHLTIFVAGGWSPSRGFYGMARK